MRWRTAAGLVLMLGALGAGGLATLLVRASLDEEAAAARLQARADGLCREAFAAKGEVREAGGAFEFRRELAPGEDWRTALMDVSAVVSWCPTRRMARFCMGRTCDLPRGVALDDLARQEVSGETGVERPVVLTLRMIEARP